jgi:hypothetical protein
MWAAKKAKQGATWPQRKLIKRFARKMVDRRSKQIAMQKRRSTQPNAAEIREARLWANGWLRTNGGKFGKFIAALGLGSVAAKVKVKGDEFVGDEFVGDEFVGDDFVGDDFVGIDPVTAALLGLSIPSLLLLLNTLLKRASKAGAPAEAQALEIPGGDGGKQEQAEESAPEGSEDAAEAPSEDLSAAEDDEASGDSLADSILGRWRNPFGKKMTNKLYVVIRRKRVGGSGMSATIYRFNKRGLLRKAITTNNMEYVQVFSVTLRRYPSFEDAKKALWEKVVSFANSKGFKIIKVKDLSSSGPKITVSGEESEVSVASREESEISNNQI